MNAPTPIREVLEPIRKLIELVEEETGANTICADEPDNESVGASADGPLPMTFGHIREARAALEALPALSGEIATVPRWRCFHCDDEFTSEHDARLHFGREEGATPACQIKGSEIGLVEALRRAENEASDAWMAIHNETTDAARAYHAQAARHRQQISTIEQVGYDRGLADAKAYPETLGIAARPVEEPGEVERLQAEVVRLTLAAENNQQAAKEAEEARNEAMRGERAAEAALAETRERLEKEAPTWRKIEERDQIVETIQTFGEVVLRNSYPVWVRGADGRVYEAVWTVDDKGRGYWWDTEGESPSDPVGILPHPLTERAALTGDAQEGGR